MYMGHDCSAILNQQQLLCRRFRTLRACYQRLVNPIVVVMMPATIWFTNIDNMFTVDMVNAPATSLQPSCPFVRHDFCALASLTVSVVSDVEGLARFVSIRTSRSNFGIFTSRN